MTELSKEQQTRTFTSIKLDLLNAISMDPRVSDCEFRTAFRLAQHANSETGAIFPSQERLADQMGKKQRTVRAAVAGLVRKGWVQIARPNKRMTNLHRFLDKHVNAILDRQAMLDEARREDRKEKALTFDRQISAPQNALTGRILPIVTGTVLPLNTLSEHLKDLGSEGEQPIRVSSTPQVYSYQSAKDGEDRHHPFPVPEDEAEAALMLKEITAGTDFLPEILNYFRKSLFAGKLTPAMVENARRVAA